MKYSFLIVALYAALPKFGENSFRIFLQIGDSEMTDVGTTGVTHAMITADGRAVPITIHPETGAYMTPDGQTLVTQEVDGQQVSLNSTKVKKYILF